MFSTYKLTFAMSQFPVPTRRKTCFIVEKVICRDTGHKNLFITFITARKTTRFSRPQENSTKMPPLLATLTTLLGELSNIDQIYAM